METTTDFIYLWVDGNDPKWLEKKRRHGGDAISSIGRYVDNQELKYSLRSVEKHIPWIRKIFIVTDNQTPKFLDTKHSKIEIVDHTEIIPKEYLPSFNSSVIEHFIHNIPNLSEHFLFSNDDIFLNADVTSNFFFQDGLPIMRMLKDPIIREKLFLKRLLNLKINTYRLAIENAYKLFRKKYNIFYPVKEHHNIHAFLKSDYKIVMDEVFKKELKHMYANRFRHKSDIHRILVNYYAIKNKTGILKYVKRKESCRIKVHRANYMRYISKYRWKKESVLINWGYCE